MITVTTPLSTGLRELADLLDQHPELAAPRVDVNWHCADDESLIALVAATPDVRWSARANGPIEWIDAKTSAWLNLRVFAAAPLPTPSTSRLEALIAAVKA